MAKWEEGHWWGSLHSHKHSSRGSHGHGGRDLDWTCIASFSPKMAGCCPRCSNGNRLLDRPLCWEQEELETVKLELEVLSYKRPKGLLLNCTCSSTIEPALGSSHGEGAWGLLRCFVPTSEGVCYNPVMTVPARYSIRHLGFRGLAPGVSAGKETACNEGDVGSIPGLGRSPGEGNGYPLQHSGLETSKDCIVHGVTKCGTWLSDFHFPRHQLHMGSSGHLLFWLTGCQFGGSHNPVSSKIH